MRRFTLLTALALAPGVSLAQEGDGVGIDAHGFVMAPSDGDIKDYLSTWRAEQQDPFSLSLEALFEYANQPLVLILKQGDEEQRLGIIEHLVAANLGVAVGVHERVGISVYAPVYLFQSGDTSFSGESGSLGPAFGDLRLNVPVNLLYSGDPKGKGAIGLSIIPFGTAPTGPSPRFLGLNGFGGGGLLAFGFDKGPFDLSLNVGMQYRPPASFENLSGGPDLLAALGIAYELTDRVGLRLEANAAPNLQASDEEVAVGATEVPVQADLSTRAYLSQSLALTAGVGTAITRGVGAAPIRVFLGINWVYGKKHPIDRDGDGFVDSLDQCKDAAEVFNEYIDDDGCPDELAAVTFAATDPKGGAVQGAVFGFEGESIGQTNSRGLVTTSDRMPGTDAAWTASAVGFENQSGTAALTEGAQTVNVTMPWLPRDVRIIAKDPEGAPVPAATASFSGETAHDPADLGDDGQEVVPLTPGGYTITVSAATHESARAPLTLAPGTSEEVVELTMAPKRVALARTEVVIADMIYFDFDKATIRPESDDLIDEIAKVLNDNPQVRKVEIQGHTSDEGTSEYNMDLSTRRMESVIDALVKHGVDRGRLVAKGFGETQPLFPNDTEEHRASNRRVVFIILEQDE